MQQDQDVLNGWMQAQGQATLAQGREIRNLGGVFLCFSELKDGQSKREVMIYGKDKKIIALDMIPGIKELYEGKSFNLLVQNKLMTALRQDYTLVGVSLQEVESAFGVKNKPSRNAANKTSPVSRNGRTAPPVDMDLYSDDNDAVQQQGGEYQDYSKLLVIGDSAASGEPIIFGELPPGTGSSSQVNYFQLPGNGYVQIPITYPNTGTATTTFTESSVAKSYSDRGDDNEHAPIPPDLTLSGSRYPIVGWDEQNQHCYYQEAANTPRRLLAYDGEGRLYFPENREQQAAWLDARNVHFDDSLGAYYKDRFTQANQPSTPLPMGYNAPSTNAQANNQSFWQHQHQHQQQHQQQPTNVNGHLRSDSSVSRTTLWNAFKQCTGFEVKGDKILIGDSTRNIAGSKKANFIAEMKNQFGDGVIGVQKTGFHIKTQFYIDLDKLIASTNTDAKVALQNALDNSDNRSSKNPYDNIAGALQIKQSLGNANNR